MYRNTSEQQPKLLPSGRLPSIQPSSVNPKVVSHGDARRVRQQQHQIRYYDRPAGPMTSLHEGQSVSVQDHEYQQLSDRQQHRRTAEGQTHSSGARVHDRHTLRSHQTVCSTQHNTTHTHMYICECVYRTKTLFGTSSFVARNSQKDK